MIKQTLFLSLLSLHYFSYASEHSERPASPLSGHLSFPTPILEMIADYAQDARTLSMPNHPFPVSPLTLTDDQTGVLASYHIVRRDPDGITFSTFYKICIKDIADDTNKINHLYEARSKPRALAHKNHALYVMDQNGDIKRYADEEALGFYSHEVGTHPDLSGEDRFEDRLIKCGLRMEEKELVSYGNGKRCVWDLGVNPQSVTSECEHNIYGQSESISTPELCVQSYKPYKQNYYSLLVTRPDPAQRLALIKAIDEGTVRK